MKNAVNKGLWIAMLFCIEIGLLTAQSAKLKGRIYCANSFENVSHANVVIKNGEGLIVTSITTGYDGRYETDSIEPGAYRLEVHSKEYTNVAMNNIYLQPGKIVNVDIAMDNDAKLVAEQETAEAERKPAPGTENKPGFLDVLGGILRRQIAGGF